MKTMCSGVRIDAKTLIKLARKVSRSSSRVFLTAVKASTDQAASRKVKEKLQFSAPRAGIAEIAKH